MPNLGFFSAASRANGIRSFDERLLLGFDMQPASDWRARLFANE
jgi:hypothetical protein